MNAFPPTILIRHRRENLKKCSLRGLESRIDCRFYKYPLKEVPDMNHYILLTLDADRELSEKDGTHGLLILDATWRYAQVMHRVIPFPDTVIKRRLPKELRTAYPRKQDDCLEPSAGLASVEALAAAYHLMGRSIDGLLDHYHWREPFLEKNQILC